MVTDSIAGRDTQTVMVPPDPSDCGVLLIGHGTRDVQGTSQFHQLCDAVAQRLLPRCVEPALLEFQEPTIPQAWERLRAKDVRYVYVVPLLLFAAGHAKQDIPELVASSVGSNANVDLAMVRPISRHPAVLDLVSSRLISALKADTNGPADSGETALLMVGRGSHDPCAQADMRVLSEIVGRRAGANATITSFYAMAKPSLTDVLDQIGLERRYRRVIVHPHLLFEGRLHRAIQKQVGDATQAHRSTEFVLAPILGPHTAIVDAVVDRIAQASTPGV